MACQAERFRVRTDQSIIVIITQGGMEKEMAHVQLSDIEGSLCSVKPALVLFGEQTLGDG